MARPAARSSGLRPWEQATLRSYLEGWRAELRLSDRRFDRLGRYLLVPSALVLSLWETIRS